MTLPNDNVQAQPLESIRKIFFHMMSSKILPLKELIVIRRLALSNFIRKQILHS